ncbi:cyclic nucleotide-binding domain-containing protein [Alteromonadaceae bacterium M269]|nr:cyclic nucleotide-binding domain-containing protein [Alteromonadaceae bacterium M269]
MSITELVEKINHCETKSCLEGEILFDHTTTNKVFYKLTKGLVAVQAQVGKELFTVAQYQFDSDKESMWFGEVPSPYCGEHNYTLRCIEDSEFEAYEWPDSIAEQTDTDDFFTAFAEVTQGIRHAKALYQSLQKLSPAINAEFLETMLKRCQFITTESNHVLFQQGDSGSSAYFLLSGKLGAYVGNRDTQVGEINRGELFGEMSVISGEERSATIIASRHSELAQISKDSFKYLSRKYPLINNFVIKTLMSRLRAQNERLQRQHKPKNRVIMSLFDNNESDTDVIKAIQSELSKDSLHFTSSETVVDALSPPHQFEDIPPHRVEAFLEDQEMKYELGLFSTCYKEQEWSHHCLKRADEVWLVIHAASSPNDIAGRITTYLQQPYWQHLKVNLILLHKSSQIRGTSAWAEHFDAHHYYHVIEGDNQSVARIARQLQDKAVSFVLGGGGAKGFAHIGVLQALEEANVPIDSVGGTSIGSVMSGWIARGFNAQQMKEAVQEYFVSVNPLGDYTLPIISLSKSSRLDKLLYHSFQEVNIEDLPIPFFCMSSNLSIAQEKCHDKGKLWRAIRASLAIPGIITPAIDNGHFLVDGGLLNNLPCDLMNDRSTGPVLAIDVTDVDNFDTQLSSIPGPWSTAWKKWISRQKVAVPTILETLLRSTMLASYNKRNDNKRKVDYYIQPDVKEFGILDFTHADEIIEKGYKTGLSIIEDVQKALPH